MKPAHIFDRDREWAALAGFAADPADEMRLAVVSGRRRKGKTFLLQALADVFGGFYFVAVESTSTDALRQFGLAVASYLGVPGTLASGSGWFRPSSRARRTWRSGRLG